MAKGGNFILKSAPLEEVFIPEEFSDEHKMIAKTAADFVAGEVVPRLEELEEQKPGLMPQLLKQAGELGLLGAAIPESYGGMELDEVSSMLITEQVARGASFALGHGAHTGIGTLPILFFGNEDQKQRYLPALASGEKLAAYALTEPGSGSDALAASSKAVLTEDGKYYKLNGTKQFITNAGFADVFVIYTKVDGDKFTAFIVDAGTPGISTGPEEKKMGIKGSSTRTVIMEDALVPVENVLHEVGKGHQVAFNILNIGRFKLAAGCVGSIKFILEEAAKYAAQRSQFGTPIANFGLIQDKLARIALDAYLTESIVYRTAGMIEDGLTGVSGGQETAKAIQEFAVECSINKVFASEALDRSADEGLQVFGGYGYTAEYPMERAYRDSRINRIFEGTNEINRLIITGTILTKALKGELPLLQAAQNLQKELVQPLKPLAAGFDGVAGLLERYRKIYLLAAAGAVQKYGDKLEREQEIIANLSDMAIELFALDSAYLRAEKSGQALAKTFAVLEAELALEKAETLARRVLVASDEGDSLETKLAALRKFARRTPARLDSIKKEIARAVLEDCRYPL